MLFRSAEGEEEVRPPVRSVPNRSDAFSQRAVYLQEVSKLSKQVTSLEEELSLARAEKLDADKEQEDLLVLLEEISAKRKVDKAKMREAQMEVSEDEDDDSDAE